MRGVVLAGGRGTRLRISTEIHNKHLLPVYSGQGAIPMIWYPINTLIQSGCKEILIVSSQEHCGDIIEFIGDGKRFGDGVDITYKIQDHNDPNRPVGIASALHLSSNWIKEEPFAVILGDNFYENSFGKEFEEFENNYIDRLVSNKTDLLAHIFLKEVADPERFGVATTDATGKVVRIVEKPTIPESKFAVTGLYLYTPHVFRKIHDLKPSARGELEVSDLNQFYVDKNKMSSTTISGMWSDMGIPESMLRTQEWINTNNYRIPLK